MKSFSLPLKQTALALSLGALLGLCHAPAALAHDTDIYFGNPDGARVVRPNILFILDTSGSMVGRNSLLPDGRTRLEHMKEALNTLLDGLENVNVGLMRFSGSPGGPVLFPVTNIDATTEGMRGEGIAVVTATLGDGSDDGEESVSTGTVNLGSYDLDMVNQGGDQIIGLRFNSVQIPRGATITNAYIRFHVGETSSDATSLTIRGQDINHAPEFTTATNNIRNRTAGGNGTSAAVAWDAIPTWTVSADPDAPAIETTPDITDIVKEIVDRNDWCSGNAMAFTIEGSGRRVAQSFETDPAAAPVLVVSYDTTNIPAANCVVKTAQALVGDRDDDAEERAGNGEMDLDDRTLDITYEQDGNAERDQYIGLRFRNVNVPRGAEIVNAYIDMKLKAQGSGSPQYQIVGQKAAKPGPFATFKNNISVRISNANKTAASVAWDNPPTARNPSTGSALVTSPNVGSIVQEIVNLSDWNKDDNAILLVIKRTSGSGKLLVRSRNDSRTNAPVLRVNYRENVTLSSTTASTVRERLKQIVTGLEASGATPIVDTLWEAGLYYQGRSVLYGKQRGPQSGTTARYTRVSHPASYTGETGVYREAGCTDANLSSSACETEEIEGSPTYISPFEEGCQNSYIVLLTDGEPNGNVTESLIESEILNGADCAGTGDGECSNELVRYYYENNLSSFADKHNIVTHVIGFGSDVTSASAVEYLQGVASAGGGIFRPAANASELVTVFQEILGKVNELPTSFVSPSLSVNAFNKLFNRDEVYFSLFSPRAKIRWPGNLKKYKLCADAANLNCTYGEVLDNGNQPAIDQDSSKIKATATSVWSSVVDGPIVEMGGAGAKVPLRDSRNVYTDAGAPDFPSTPVNLSGSSYIVNTTNVTKALLGLADDSSTDGRHSNIVSWMRGQDIMDEDPDDPADADSDPNPDGDTNEDRWKFADALHSRPLTVTYGGTEQNPVIKIFVGTNDGGLRMINAATGEEEWIVYISDFLDRQGQLMDNPAGNSSTHFYGMDGTPTAYVIDKDGDGIIERGDGDRVYLYIGQRRGGRNIYAFDVTPDQDAGIADPNNTTAVKPKFLWRIRGGTGSFGELGETWSRPQVATIRIKCNGPDCSDGNADTEDSDTKTVLIFTGGYDSGLDNPGTGNVVPSGSDAMGRAIYMVDPITGSLVWWVGGSSSGANLVIPQMQYAIPSDPALVDTNHDGAIDRIYVGDSRGQLFRIDLGDQIDPGQTGDGGSSGYVFATVGSTANQAKRKFFYAPDVTQVRDTIYSTEPEYDLIAVVTGDREDPLDKLTAGDTSGPVQNRVYVFRDYNIATGRAPDSDPSTTNVWDPPVALTEADLYDATLNKLGTETGTALQTEIDTLKAKKGWYIDLREVGQTPTWIGEKGLAKPVIFDGVLFFTTYVPPQFENNTSSCSATPEGIARAYAINYMTGTPVFDLTGDNVLDRYDEIGGGIPSEVVIVIREDGVTTLVGTSGGAANPSTDLEMPRYQTYWYEE